MPHLDRLACWSRLRLVKVFISWSGDKSREVALALRDWLPGVINSIEPFVSAKDIYAGSRWQMEIASQLDATHFGIVCVTNDNQLASWLNFEAGALAKSVDSSRVVPLAVDLKPSDVRLPLGQFQAQPATKGGVHEILRSINTSCETPLDTGLLDRSFSMWWPELETRLAAIGDKAAPSDTSVRSDRELLEETLITVRSLTHSYRGAADSSRLPEDHPLLSELKTILEASGLGFRLLRAPGWRVAIRFQRGMAIPRELMEEIRRRADVYTIAVDFLVSMEPGSSLDDGMAVNVNLGFQEVGD